MTNRAFYLLCLLSCAVGAEPVFESVTRTNMGWKISARPTADERPITVCQLTLYDVLAGERIKIEGWAQVDAMTTLIGVNTQIAYCDDAEPQCNYSGRRWPANSSHRWASENTWRVRGTHHPTYSPRANYVSSHHQQAVTFKLFVNIYSTQPRGAYAGVNDCGIDFYRYRD